jgi:hypothetical protein
MTDPACKAFLARIFCGVMTALPFAGRRMKSPPAEENEKRRGLPRLWFVKNPVQEAFNLAANFPGFTSDIQKAAQGLYFFAADGKHRLRALDAQPKPLLLQGKISRITCSWTMQVLWIRKNPEPESRCSYSESDTGLAYSHPKDGCAAVAGERRIDVNNIPNRDEVGVAADSDGKLVHRFRTRRRPNACRQQLQDLPDAARVERLEEVVVDAELESLHRVFAIKPSQKQSAPLASAFSQARQAPCPPCRQMDVDEQDVELLAAQKRHGRDPSCAWAIFASGRTVSIW